MRIAVTGRNGQIVQSLLERAGSSSVEVFTLARLQLDFARPDAIEALLKTLRPDAVVNAAAYTDVDLAESETERAHLVNSVGAGVVATAAAKLGVPIVQLSTDYVFDGNLERSYGEDDATGPVNVYGQTKLEGERAVSLASEDHVILRTAWIYSPFGQNFARTMLALADKQDEIPIVSDQIGAPTNALDLADGILTVVKSLVARPDAAELRGIFHITGDGETNWAEFAEAIFSASAAVAGPSARVIPISTASYPTAARRPANSRLDNTRIADIHGVRLPHWRRSLLGIIERLVARDYQQKDDA